MKPRTRGLPNARPRRESWVLAALVAVSPVHRAFGFKFWAFVSGGGALPGPLEQFWNALGFVLVQGYGMTETTALITLNHPFHVAQGTIGKPLAGREVKLGPDGEVLVRGAVIFGCDVAGRTAAAARGRVAGDGRHCGAAGIGRTSDSWAARAR